MASVRQYRNTRVAMRKMTTIANGTCIFALRKPLLFLDRIEPAAPGKVARLPDRTPAAGMLRPEDQDRGEDLQHGQHFVAPTLGLASLPLFSTSPSAVVPAAHTQCREEGNPASAIPGGSRWHLLHF